jgi:uncharacterized protein
MSISSKTALLLFARTPALGAVKTRLAADIGAPMALSLHIAFINDCLKYLTSVDQTDCYLYLTSPWDTGVAPLPNLLAEKSITIKYQAQGDLGARMQQAILESFNTGYRAVIIFGSDSPNLPGEYLQAAIDALIDNDCVVGPSEDGGYYLIGARVEIAEQLAIIFQDINWSTDTVFDETVQRITAIGWRGSYLPKWYDVDTLSDLIRLKQDLTGSSSQINKILQERD